MSSDILSNPTSSGIVAVNAESAIEPDQHTSSQFTDPADLGRSQNSQDEVAVGKTEGED